MCAWGAHEIPAPVPRCLRPPVRSTHASITADGTWSGSNNVEPETRSRVVQHPVCHAAKWPGIAMAFSDMPVLEPLVLPGGPDYAERVLEMSRRAVATSRTVLDVPLGQDYWQKLDLFLPRDPSLTNLP